MKTHQRPLARSIIYRPMTKANANPYAQSPGKSRYLPSPGPLPTVWRQDWKTSVTIVQIYAAAVSPFWIVHAQKRTTLHLNAIIYNVSDSFRTIWRLPTKRDSRPLNFQFQLGNCVILCDPDGLAHAGSRDVSCFVQIDSLWLHVCANFSNTKI